jgi:hypothetical protein
VTIEGVALKDATVRDYRRWTERAGERVDMAAIERQAVADCEVADKAIREQAARAHVVAAPDPEKEAEKAAELSRQVAETGAELLDDAGAITSRRTLLTSKAMPKSQWSYAMGRVARILEGTPHNPPPGSLQHDLLRLKAWAAMRIPKRARHLIATRRAKDEQNPFDGKSERDFNRMLQRMIYDICDKSTGKFGPWWVR